MKQTLSASHWSLSVFITMTETGQEVKTKEILSLLIPLSSQETWRIYAKRLGGRKRSIKTTKSDKIINSEVGKAADFQKAKGRQYPRATFSPTTPATKAICFLLLFFFFLVWNVLFCFSVTRFCCGAQTNLELITFSPLPCRW